MSLQRDGSETSQIGNIGFCVTEYTDQANQYERNNGI